MCRLRLLRVSKETATKPGFFGFSEAMPTRTGPLSNSYFAISSRKYRSENLELCRRWTRVKMQQIRKARKALGLNSDGKIPLAKCGCCEKKFGAEKRKHTGGKIGRLWHCETCFVEQVAQEVEGRP